MLLSLTSHTALTPEMRVAIHINSGLAHRTGTIIALCFTSLASHRHAAHLSRRADCWSPVSRRRRIWCILLCFCGLHSVWRPARNVRFWFQDQPCLVERPPDGLFLFLLSFWWLTGCIACPYLKKNTILIVVLLKHYNYNNWSIGQVFVLTIRSTLRQLRYHC